MCNFGCFFSDFLLLEVSFWAFCIHSLSNFFGPLTIFNILNTELSVKGGVSAPGHT